MIDGAVVISRPFGYAPPYIELTLAVACYLPAAEADTGKARRSYLLLSPSGSSSSPPPPIR
jgi:hypothetical protein